MFATRTAATLAGFLAWGLVSVSPLLGQTSRASGPAPSAKKLPEGFEPIEGSRLHSTGYPMEIRCKKDGSVMVFVPGGEFTSGLSDEQVANLALRLEPEPNTAEADRPMFMIEANVADLAQIKPGKMLTQEDLQDIAKKDYQHRLCVLGLELLQSEGNEVPQEELNRWRKEGRTVKALLSLPGIQKATGLTPEDANSLAKMLTETAGDAARERREQTRKVLRQGFPTARAVRLGPYYIDKFEVTNRQYRKFLEDIPDPNRRPGMWVGPGYNLWGPGKKKFYSLLDDPQRGGEEQPVTCVGEGDVLAYAGWAGRHPASDAQWRRAALGDGKRLFPWGDEFDPNLCKYGGPTSAGAASAPALEAMVGSAEKIAAAPRRRDKVVEALRMVPKISAPYGEIRGLIRDFRQAMEPPVPAKVGSYPKDVSPFGCCDLAGSVSEWVVAEAGRPHDSPSLAVVGGNANTVETYRLSPALERSYESPGKLVGFRTVLPLPVTAPSTRAGD